MPVFMCFSHFPKEIHGGLQPVLRLKEGTTHRIRQRSCTSRPNTYRGRLNLDLKIPFTIGHLAKKTTEIEVKGMNFGMMIVKRF